MIRVCHFISGLDPVNGGPAVAMAGLAAAQVQAGLDVTVMATWVDTPGEKQAEKMRADGVKVRLFGPCTNPMSRHPDLPAAVDEMVASCDVAHIHALFEEIQHQAARSAAGRRIPYIIRPCGMLDPWALGQGKWRKKLYLAFRLKKNLDRAAAIHYTADLERELALPVHIKAPPIIEPNGVDLREFQTLPPKGSFKNKYPELTGKRIILFLSRLHLKKGLDLLVPAFAKAQLPDTTLVIAGPDSDGYLATIRKMIQDNSITDRVLITGPIYGPDRVAALADADLFALPSYSENFGVAVVEALAAGRPVVISDKVNIYKEILDAKVGGVVPLDIPKLTDELKRWINDSTLRESAADNARPFVWSAYDWSRIAERWASHYARLSGK